MTRYLPLLAILALLAALAAQVATAAAAPLGGPSPNFAAFDLHHPAEAEEDEEEGDESEVGDDEMEIEDCEVEGFGIEFEEEEGEEEISEAEEEEFEEDCEDATKKKDAPYVSAPAACHISRAESTITTLPAADQVRLTLRYRTWAPTPVAIGLKLRDAKGAVAIERTTAHLGAHGTLHITTKLGGSVMERALKASEFDVSLLAPSSPSYCASELEQRLHSATHMGGKSPRVYSNRS